MARVRRCRRSDPIDERGSQRIPAPPGRTDVRAGDQTARAATTCRADATGGVTTTRTHHYDGSSDNPAWTDEGTGWTRNIGGIGGDLSAIHHSATCNTFQVANLRV